MELPSELQDTSSAEKLHKDSAQHICSGFFLLGKEVAVESHNSNVFSPSMIAQAMNN